MLYRSLINGLVMKDVIGLFNSCSRSGCSFRTRGSSTQRLAVSVHAPAAQLLSPASTAGMATKWTSHGSQQDFMQRDNCILVSEDDVVTGSANKFDSHQFLPHQPRGLLHRAFSVFLFNSAGQLLLQQRATEKITFPGVWTNTCCSHPLIGQHPDEVDVEDAVEDGSVPGVKAAAVRKLHHELGIRPEQLPPGSFKYLTRLHYCAADTDTHGPQSPWGEHEIDYILLAQADVDLHPNPEEVAAVKHVSLPELQQMMDPASGLKWSPWFRIIAHHFLPLWWADLPQTLNTNVHVDTRTIHRLTC